MNISNTFRVMNIFRAADNLMAELICTETLSIILPAHGLFSISHEIFSLRMSFKFYFEGRALRNIYSIEFMAHG